MIFQLVRWLVGVPRKWIALAAMIVVAAMNPLFLTLDDDAFEQPATIKYRSVDIKLSSDISLKVAHIRQKGIWIVSDNNLSAFAGSSEKETDGPDSTDNTEWRLVGLISSENGNEAVLQQGTNYVYSVVEGDQLPSGEQVVALGDDYLTLRTDDIEKRLPLYPDSF